MRLDRWMKGSVTAAAVVALAACASQDPTTPTPEPERRVLSVTGEADIPAMLAQLPERIPIDQADELLVQVDPNKVSEVSPTYSVQNRRGFGGRGFGRAFRYGYAPGFRGLYRNFAYYPLGSYYFPYYAAGGFYYPYAFADRAYNPFFYGPGNNWIPAYWAW
ncbi:MAG: hypothetical protein ACLGIN_04305 [Candidatus Sericytochromatia bacterium]